MSRSLKTNLLSESLDLLLHSALAPQDQAISAWHQWRQKYDINLTPWNEVRILGAVANRIDWLEPGSNIRPRLMGIRKFLWVQTQFCLKKTRPGLKVLSDDGIPILLLKGGARIAENPSSAQERLIRDLDILIPLGFQDRAFKQLESVGWKLVPLPWQVASFQKAPISGHHAWSLQREGGEIDLHHYSNNLNRLIGDDDEFWRRAKVINWDGIPVYILCSSYALLTILIHGLRWSQDRSADWAIDACALIDQNDIEWNIFILEAQKRVVQAIIFSGLYYLKEVLGKSIPLFVLSELESQLDKEMISELTDFYSLVASPISPHQVECFQRLAFRRVQTGRFINKISSLFLAGLFKINVNLSQGDSVGISLTPNEMQYEWLILEIHIPIPHLANVGELTGRFSSVGFEMKYSGADSIKRETQGITATFRIEIAVALLELRGINEVNFSYWFDNVRIENLLLTIEGFSAST
jgi:hypothetical protein